MAKRRKNRAVAGDSTDDELSVDAWDRAGGRPLSTHWISDERIADTIRVWSPYYGRQLTQDEAIEICQNVKRFAEVLIRAQRELAQKQPEGEPKIVDADLGAGI